MRPLLLSLWIGLEYMTNQPIIIAAILVKTEPQIDFPSGLHRNDLKSNKFIIASLQRKFNRKMHFITVQK